jgi:sulfatase maturation enzyme AslB (radical SAM superfamily)
MVMEEVMKHTQDTSTKPRITRQYEFRTLDPHRQSDQGRGFYDTLRWPAKADYYRLPWSNNDNPIAWLEITDLCNVYCKGCYRTNLEGHRPLDELKKEVDFFCKVRNPDSITIAGGEPLVYPHIAELVSYIKSKGLKPHIISNVSALDRTMMERLWKAGMFTITMHIDALQERREFPAGKVTEDDLLNLRLEKAKLVHEVSGGKCTVTWNQTVYHETFPYIPHIVRFAQANLKYVSGLVFITYRGAPISGGVEWVSSDHTLDAAEMKKNISYSEADTSQIDIKSVDVWNLLRDTFPEYEACSYVGGTGHIQSYKWFIHTGVYSKNGMRMYGSIGKRTMEYLQTQHHWKKGRYFVYLPSNRVSPWTILASAFIGDKSLHKARVRLLAPWKWFGSLRSLAIGIVQAPDMLPSGTADMCDSCPDMCVWNGNLVNSCRLDEYRQYGGLLNAIVHTDNDKRPEADRTVKAAGG